MKNEKIEAYHTLGKFVEAKLSHYRNTAAAYFFVSETSWDFERKNFPVGINLKDGQKYALDLNTILIID